MARKKRPPVPQSIRPGRDKPKPTVAEVGADPKSFRDRLSVYLYYVPLLIASWFILPHEIRFAGGHLAVKSWTWVISILFLWAIGPYYLRALREMRMRRQR
jgi:hypothetical protein